MACQAVISWHTCGKASKVTMLQTATYMSMTSFTSQWTRHLVVTDTRTGGPIPSQGPAGWLDEGSANVQAQATACFHLQLPRPCILLILELTLEPYFPY